MELTFADAIGYLESFVNYEKTGLDPLKNTPDIEKIHRVLEKLGNPHHSYHSIHIAGTKGKGSIASIVSSILAKSGYKTGLFTSPHIHNIRERFQINNNLITEEDFISSVFSVQKIIDDAKSNINFTFFEVLTVAAIKYFADQNADFVVFECGLGGRLDSTNVITPLVCGFSPVSYDHMNILGNDLIKIATEKSGIIKNGIDCVSSPQNKQVLDVLMDKCLEKRSTFVLVGEDIRYNIKNIDDKGIDLDVEGVLNKYKSLHLNMLGDFQAENTTTALGICERIILSGHGDNITLDSVKEGLEAFFIPGRLEILRKKPYLVIDGAQNSASAARLKYSVEQIFKYDKLILLLGASDDKDIPGICKELVSFADKIVLTRSRSKRAIDPLLIRGYIRNKDVVVTDDPKEALGVAFSDAGEEDLILAAGSFYLIGEIRDMLSSKNI